jgi:hypothetical protein
MPPIKQESFKVFNSFPSGTRESSVKQSANSPLKYSVSGQKPVENRLKNKDFQGDSEYL